VDFVRGVTTADGRQFVKPEERVAVFDNDGTLWSEYPMYFQFAFVLDRLKVLAPQHPEWKDNPLIAGVLEGDMKAVAAGGERGLLELATVTHAGMTSDEFPKDCGGLARKRQASEIQSSLHRSNFPADVGAS
jgi:hypothetical protein